MMKQYLTCVSMCVTVYRVIREKYMCVNNVRNVQYSEFNDK